MCVCAHKLCANAMCPGVDLAIAHPLTGQAHSFIHSHTHTLANKCTIDDASVGYLRTPEEATALLKEIDRAPFYLALLRPGITRQK